MANSESRIQQEIANEEEKSLKYLEFVQVAAVHTFVCFSNLYDYAKNNSGPLKPGVETVEGTVKTVVGPVYDKFHDVPIDVLKFVDRKVDESMGKVSNVSSQVKQVTAQARSMATEVPRASVDTATGVAKSVYAKYEPTAKQLYSKYEPVAEQCAASTWRKLNQLPLFPRVAQVVVPTAAYCSEKYNQTVQCTAEKGYKVSSFLPLVPTEKIAKIFSNDADKLEPLVPGAVGADIFAH